MENTDSRITAWHAIADHPLFASCYEDEEEETLLGAILKKCTEIDQRSTMTDSEFRLMASRLFQRWPDLGVFMSRLGDEMEALGTTVVEDPKPSNVELIEKALRSCNYAGGPEYIAQQLDELGVTAPGGDDE